MADRLRDYRRNAPRDDEHDLDPRDLYYLPDGVYKAVRRDPIYAEREIVDAGRTVLMTKRVATAVKVVKIRSYAQDAGTRREARPDRPRWRDRR